MKKLMIAAAIVCVAAMSQAAAFTWATSDVVYMPWKIANIEEGTFSAASSGSAKKAETWADNGANFTYVMLIDGVQSTGSVSFDNGAISLTANNDGFSLPTSGDKTISYDIVINGTYNDGVDDWTIESDHITGSQTYTSLSTAQLDTAVPTEWTFAAATPEPTSGLLLLIGMGALALRRKQK